MSTCRGRLAISVKYDVGGRILQRSDLVAALGVDPGAGEPPDTRMYNFSYLALTSGPIPLPDETLQIDGVPWQLTTRVDEPGVISFLLTSPLVPAEDEDALVSRLLELNHQFVETKNVDYVQYLDDHGLMVKSLEQLRPSERPPASAQPNFRDRVHRIRTACAPHLAERPVYVFHDFRPIFLWEQDTLPRPQCLTRLLSLPPASSLAFVPRSLRGETSELWGQQIVGAGWAYCVARGEGTDRIIDLFGYVHAQWFIAQASLYQLRQLDDYIVGRGRQEFARGTADVRRMSQDILWRKTEILHQLFIVRSSDFITKNGSVNAAIDFFKGQFGIPAQLGILETQLDHLTSFLRDVEGAIRIRQDESIRQAADKLEILFSISAITGIAGIVTILYATDLGQQVNRDPPRLAAISVILLTTLLYLAAAFSRGAADDVDSRCWTPPD